MLNHQMVLVFLLLYLGTCSALPIPSELSPSHLFTGQLDKRLGIGIRLKASHRGRSKKTGNDIGFQVGIGFDTGVGIGNKNEGKGIKIASHMGLSAIGKVFTDTGSGVGEIGLKTKAEIEMGIDSTGKKIELGANVGINTSVNASVETGPKSMPWDISFHDIDPEEFKRLLKNNQLEKL